MVIIMESAFKLQRLTLVVLILTVVFLTAPPINAAESPAPKTIKVGCVEGYGITMDNGCRGYIVDYINEISMYTNWNCEYVLCEWSEGLKMLENGEIDLLGPIQKSDEREKKFDFSAKPIGVEYGAIYVSKDNTDIFYNDIQSLNGKKIASLKDNYYDEVLHKYCKKNGINAEIFSVSKEELDTALSSGKYDAVVIGSVYDMENTALVTKIAVEESYFATTKGNTEVSKSLNFALNEILIDDAHFEATLFKKYYGKKTISNPAFTYEESEFIKATPKLRVVCDPNWAPITVYDKEKNKFTGIGIDLFEEICKSINLPYEIIATENKSESIRLLDNGEAELIIGSDNDYAHAKTITTDPIIQIPMVIAGRDVISPNRKIQFAMTKDEIGVCEEIAKTYPNFVFTEYPSAQELLKALIDKKESNAVLSYYAFDKLIWMTPDYTFNMIPTDLSTELKIGISPHADSRMVGILNKAILRLPSEKGTAINFANSPSQTEKVPLERVLQENIRFLLIVVILVFAILLFVILAKSKRTGKRLQEIAFIDRATRLPSLEKFRIDAIELLKTAKSNQYVLLHLDIDNFKYINESYGHDVGNRVLKAISEHFMEHKSYYELIGRISADNFVFFAKSENAELLQSRYEKMCDVSHHLKNILTDDYEITFSASFYFISDPKESFSTMLDKVNSARKQGKSRQCNSLIEYSREMDADVQWKREVTLCMAKSLENNEFKPFFQPKIDLVTEKIVGAEALVRWVHPTYGLVMPNRFIPLFENNGFICKLDFYMLEAICKMIKRLKDEGITPVPISVNLSRDHFHNPNLVEEIVKITEKHNIEPYLIEAELTESLVFGDKISLISSLSNLRNLGFSISIDDFGSGYSSLSLLSELPANVIKFDKDFVKSATTTQYGKNIIGKTIEMAKSINLQTVAEGVEEKEQVLILRALGCDIAQGYYYARPMPADEFFELIKGDK